MHFFNVTYFILTFLYLFIFILTFLYLLFYTYYTFLHKLGKVWYLTNYTSL